MTPLAITFLALSILIVWGGMTASILFLRHRPELAEYPSGEIDDERDTAGIIEHDT